MKKIVLTSVMLLVALTLLVTVSCSKENNDEDKEPVYNELTIGKEKVAVTVGKVVSVEVKGTGNYELKTSDDKIVTVTQSKNKINIKGVADGATIITITDTKIQQSKKIFVSVGAYVEITTTKAVGEEYYVSLDAEDKYKSSIWVDFNNNYKKDVGEEITEFSNNSLKGHKLKSQTFRIYGNIFRISIPRNQGLKNLDISHNNNLKNVGCNKNEELKSIDVSKNTNLEILTIVASLKTLDVSKNTELIHLDCRDNELEALNISKNTKLTYLDCKKNKLEALNISKNTKLTEIVCNSNQLTSLDVSQNKGLETLNCIDNQLSSLDISRNKELNTFYCGNNQLTNLDISRNNKLEIFHCNNNQLTSLDVSNNTVLTDFDCSKNQLESLDVSMMPVELDDFSCKENPNLTCIKVSAEQLEVNDWWEKDDTASFNTTCD